MAQTSMLRVCATHRSKSRQSIVKAAHQARAAHAKRKCASSDLTDRRKCMTSWFGGSA